MQPGLATRVSVCAYAFEETAIEIATRRYFNCCFLIGVGQYATVIVTVISILLLV
jgi:hypothetical protein